MRIKYFFITILLLVLVIPNTVLAVEQKPTINFFWGEGCPHCTQEEFFLQQLVQTEPDVIINRFEVFNNRDNAKLLDQVAEQLNVSANGVPVTIIGSNYQIGYLNDQTTGTWIKQQLAICRQQSCSDAVSQFTQPPETKPRVDSEPNFISLPLFGQVDTSQISLGALTLIIGFLDGFNPCAMWTLILLISLLLGIESKKRRWLLGLAFLSSSAIVYYLFLAAWLNIFMFLGMIMIIRMAIGLVALLAGYLNLRSWQQQRTGCEAKDEEKKKATYQRLRVILSKNNIALALLGIVLLGAAVNMVELLCSAGLPAIYTQLLAQANLSTGKYYWYLFWYIIFYMLDDLIVFSVAMIVLKPIGVSGKYSLWVKLIGGVLMVLLGLIMIFQPSLLMFG